MMKLVLHSTRSNKATHLRVLLSIILATVLLLTTLIIYALPSRAATAQKQDSITLQDFSICTSGCTYPSPYVSGIILINNSSPLVSLQLIVDGVNQTTLHFSNDFLNYAYWYKGTFSSPAAVAGQQYQLQYVATFTDNSKATSAVEVAAS